MGSLKQDDWREVRNLHPPDLKASAEIVESVARLCLTTSFLGGLLHLCDLGDENVGVACDRMSVPLIVDLSADEEFGTIITQDVVIHNARVACGQFGETGMAASVRVTDEVLILGSMLIVVRAVSEAAPESLPFCCSAEGSIETLMACVSTTPTVPTEPGPVPLDGFVRAAGNLASILGRSYVDFFESTSEWKMQGIGLGSRLLRAGYVDDGSVWRCGGWRATKSLIDEWVNSVTRGAEALVALARHLWESMPALRERGWQLVTMPVQVDPCMGGFPGT
jgi:hypothetical protein